jgi:diaminopimelate decarboxylase
LESEEGMDESIRERINAVVADAATPCFVYFAEEIAARIADLQRALRGHFTISYAVKANPNLGLLRFLRTCLDTMDVSSAGELDRIAAAGFDVGKASFSGPCKRDFELRRAVELGCGDVVCESLSQIEKLDRFAGEAGKRMAFLIRINPTRVPRRFGVNMAGKPSQFGIDEECVDEVLERRHEWRNLDLHGFHIYSGTNCLDEAAIAENFSIFIELFQRFSDAHHLEPKRLVFGSGFGIPYTPAEQALDLEDLAGRINPQMDAMRAHPRLRRAEAVLEMGRWLVGPAGYMVTEVVDAKASRGVEIRLCDAGFNNLLPAFGLMGSVIRRNWRIAHLGHDVAAEVPRHKYLLTGPLCTTIDVLATDIELPELHVGDRLVVESAGAYGVSASPLRFISHPEPQELLVREDGETLVAEDITEAGATIEPRVGSFESNSRPAPVDAEVGHG